ncbi:retropepsin-like aspartic protease [Mucilaginibacter sp. OK283]|uniref:retropepsin-like aspartic protease n=1 Tax=Mucilaginibacter sp. OK283 TaxID=1881049 RepID=UPI0008D73B1F|nr:retropepsin-like aspartic protease [Mucilaginibacter sp. OK283]SEO36753.1 gag-polyprotein putative aspartyl protease [Mucilaginibacter sp. OK283]
MAVVTFPNSKLYVGSSLKPLADVVLIGPGGRRFRIAAALVDTGADFFQVPESAARAVGLLPGGTYTVVSVRTAGGIITMKKLSAVQIEIESALVTIEVLCSPLGISTPLVGRNALRALSNIGFSTIDWMW